MSQFDEFVLQPFISRVQESSNRDAFCIEDERTDYSQFAEIISGIRSVVKELPEEVVGVVARNDIETYASIFALWLELKAYVPLDPNSPQSHNLNIIEASGVTNVLDSLDIFTLPSIKSLPTKGVVSEDIYLTPKTGGDDMLAYILFTSGTTGKPKGVPLSRGNVAAFIESLWDMGVDVQPGENCLQMFELTFDLSVMSYLAPLLKGGCVWTIPTGKLKYMYIFELLDEEILNVALMVPSTINYLRPYFEEINNKSLRLNLFCGEALGASLTTAWSNCIPNARIFNVYGPTESTIFCSSYEYKRNGENKTHNGVLSIGKPLRNSLFFVLDEFDEILEPGKTGELCIGGKQLTSGYLNNQILNNQLFIKRDIDGYQIRLYKSGDLVWRDKEDDVLFVGRLDSQVKIQGFRIELSEVEFQIKNLIGNRNVVALVIESAAGYKELALVIESVEFDIKELLDQVKQKLPAYMIPSRLKFTDEFPLNINGKVDRKSLAKLFI